MKHIESLAVKYHQEKVGTLSLSADGKVIVAIVARKPFSQMRMVIGWSSLAIPTTSPIAPRDIMVNTQHL